MLLSSYWWTPGPSRPSVQSSLNLEHLFTSGPGCSDLTHQPNSLFRARWQSNLSLSRALSTTAALTEAWASQITLSVLTARPTGNAPGLGTAAHRWPDSSGSSSPSCQKTNCPTDCTFMNSPPGLGCRKEVKENPWPTQLCDRNGLFLFKSFNGLRTQYYAWLYGFQRPIIETREISTFHVSSKV